MPLYKFYRDCGRMGDLEGTFEASKEDVRFIIGKDVDFGEVLGKHSEVCIRIKKSDIKLLTEDEDFIGKAKQY